MIFKYNFVNEKADEKIVVCWEEVKIILCPVRTSYELSGNILFECRLCAKWRDEIATTNKSVQFKNVAKVGAERTDLCSGVQVSIFKVCSW